MSFRKGLEAVYSAGIKAAVENLGVTCTRADKLEFTGDILQTVLSSIRNAYFVVADITGARPDCYYEIGVAHALNKKVILLQKRGTCAHFNVRGFNALEYEAGSNLKGGLRDRIIGDVLTQAPKVD